MRRALLLMIVSVFGFSLALAAAPDSGRKLQCWTDEKGQRACGDRVPPQYAKQERQVINSQGMVVGTKARQKTDAEIAEEQRKAEAAAAEKKRLEEQTAYDKYLLQTFSNVAELQGVRDTRVATLDGRLKLAEKSVADTEASLKGLRERAAADQKAGKPVDARLGKQIKEFEAALVDGHKAVDQLRKDREQIGAKFDKDIERYKKLRTGEIQMGSPAS